MTGSIRIFEKSNFTPKLSVLVFLKVKLPNMTNWHKKLLTNSPWNERQAVWSLLIGPEEVSCRGSKTDGM